MSSTRTLLAATSFGLAGLGLVGLAAAQTTTGALDPSEVPLQSALEQLRSQQYLYLSITSTDTVAGKATTTATDLWWSIENPGTVNAVAKIDLIRKLEPASGSGGSPVNMFRVIGDGTNLYVYDFFKYEVSTVPYGPVTSSNQAQYVPNLLDLVNAAARGVDTYGADFLRQVYGGTASTYRRWIPAASPQGSGQAVVYTQARPAERQITFQYTTDASNPSNVIYTITEIDGEEAKNIGSTRRVTTWKIVPLAPTTISADFFTPFGVYVPKANPSDKDILWKVVPPPRPIG